MELLNTESNQRTVSGPDVIPRNQPGGPAETEPDDERMLSALTLHFLPTTCTLPKQQQPSSAITAELLE